MDRQTGMVSKAATKIKAKKYMFESNTHPPGWRALQTGPETSYFQEPNW